MTLWGRVARVDTSGQGVSSREAQCSLSSIRLGHGDLLVMDGLAQSEYEHSTSSELQGQPGHPYLPVDNAAHPDPHITAGGGLLCSTVVCARFARAGSPGGRGPFSMAHVGVVCPLAGGRCVPRTGVHLDCPLQVAWPAASPCLSLFPYSDANCPSSRAGALDRCQTVEGATAP